MANKNTLPKWAFATVYTCVVAICIILDQLTKSFIFDQLLGKTQGNSVPVLGSFLRFYSVYNEGASFGMAQSDANDIIFFVITVVGVPLFVWLLCRSRTRSVCSQLGFAFVIGGTVGNAIDRGFVATTAGKFFSGKVRDFISFSIFPPIFNVADSFLVIGVALAILGILFFDFDGLVPEIKKERTMRNAEKDNA